MSDLLGMPGAVHSLVLAEDLMTLSCVVSVSSERTKRYFKVRLNFLESVPCNWFFSLVVRPS